MHRESPLYAIATQRFYSMLMLCLLLWLTVSTPFVYDAQQDAQVTQGIAGADEDNPLQGTNEEKAESGNTLSEYLHEAHHFQLPALKRIAFQKCRPDGLYYAFHPDLFAPPPEA